MASRVVLMTRLTHDSCFSAIFRERVRRVTFFVRLRREASESAFGGKEPLHRDLLFARNSRSEFTRRRGRFRCHVGLGER